MKKITKQSVLEHLLLIGIFSGGMIPLRLAFYENFSHYWIGTVGVLSIFTFVIYFLSKKNKLGKVGIIIIKRLHKRAKGKIGTGFLIGSIFIIYIMGFAVVGCIMAKPEYVKLFNDASIKMGITSINGTLVNLALNDAKDIPTDKIPYLLFIVYTPNDLSFASIKNFDNISHGWLYSLALVLLVEEIEFLGILCYFRYKVESLSITSGESSK